jgi:hypothetical protein
MRRRIATMSSKESTQGKINTTLPGEAPKTRNKLLHNKIPSLDLTQLESTTGTVRQNPGRLDILTV